MISKIQKWGNSQGIRIPKSIIDQCHISVGEELIIIVDGGEITIKPASRIRGKYDLKELIKKIPQGYEAKEEEWGKTQGKEVW